MDNPHGSLDGPLMQIRDAVAQKDKTIAQFQNIFMLYDRNHWESEKGKTPLNLNRSVDAVTDSNNDTIYFREAESNPARIDSYKVSTGVLRFKYDPAPIRCSLVYFDPCILVIGGAISREKCAQRIGKVTAINPHDSSIQKEYPDMPTRRSRATALTYVKPHSGHTLLIVIGGEDDQGEPLNKVEILDLTEPKGMWKRAQDIPETVICSSGTIVNGVIYLLGGWRQLDKPTSSAFKCRVEDLYKTTQPGSSTEKVWKPLPDLPVYQAACTSYNGCVIAVGGMSNNMAVHDIRTYNEDHNRWETIGYLPNPRYNCYAVGLPDKLMVFGGKKDSTSNQDMVDTYYKIRPAQQAA